MNMLYVSNEKGRRFVFVIMDLWGMGGFSVLIKMSVSLELLLFVGIIYFVIIFLGVFIVFVWKDIEL